MTFKLRTFTYITMLCTSNNLALHLQQPCSALQQSCGIMHLPGSDKLSAAARKPGGATAVWDTTAAVNTFSQQCPNKGASLIW
ncbi:hypothetical protein WJX79_000722 [Trebouxia sp. C0005]